MLEEYNLFGSEVAEKKEGDSSVSFLNVNPQTHNMG